MNKIAACGCVLAMDGTLLWAVCQAHLLALENIRQAQRALQDSFGDDQVNEPARQLRVRICRRCGVKIDEQDCCSVGCALDDSPDARPPLDTQTLIYRYVGTEAEVAQHIMGDGASLRARLAALECCLAERVARDVHHLQKDTVTGEPYVLHLARVAAQVESPQAKAVAWLHDAIEDTPLRLDDLAQMGFSPETLAAIDLLTRRELFTYAGYIEQIHRSGNALARAVKVADLRDHLQPNCPERLAPRYKNALKLLAEGDPQDGPTS